MEADFSFPCSCGVDECMITSQTENIKKNRELTANQDPCGPMYDPVRNLYHLHYQFHPNHVNWGMISSHNELFKMEYLSDSFTR
jgi:hypothetical protein